MATNPNTGGFTGISLAGTWECGNCGASGDGFWDEDDGLRIFDGAVELDDHVCEDSS